MTRAALLALLLLVAVPAARADDPAPLPPLCSPSVGLRAQVEVALPGPRLVARPLAGDDQVVLRVVSVAPAGPDRLRYQLELYGLRPGRHDLGRYLMREDGSPPLGIPPLPIEVLSVIPPGPAEPGQLAAQAAPRLGGYRLLMGLAVVLWGGGLLALMFVRRGPRAAPPAPPPAPPPRAAELLRPLVQDALGGRIDTRGQARLEALILETCRERLGLGELPAREAMTRLRADPEAGPIVAALELWLHAPPGPDGQERGRAALTRVLGATEGRPA